MSTDHTDHDTDRAEDEGMVDRRPRNRDHERGAHDMAALEQVRARDHGSRITE